MLLWCKKCFKYGKIKPSIHLLVLFISDFFYIPVFEFRVENPAGYMVSGMLRISGRISGIRLLYWTDIRKNQYPVHP
jgi:hypothetical protein